MTVRLVCVGGDTRLGGNMLSMVWAAHLLRKYPPAPGYAFDIHRFRHEVDLLRRKFSAENVECSGEYLVFELCNSTNYNSLQN